MTHRSNPRGTRLHLLLAMLLVGLAAATPALAGNTHSEGGAVVEAPGVPETDGTAQVQIYWTGDSAARSTSTVGATLAGYWLQDVGFALARPWLVGDEHAAVLEFQTGAGTSAHAGFYGVAIKNLTSLDPDEFPSLTVRPIPAPVATAGGGFIDLAWSRAAVTSPASIAGYDVYRSSDGAAFTKINTAVVTDSTYHDAAVVFGQPYQYALALVYRGAPPVAGTALSVNSAPATSLDTTPPNVPTLAAEPPFTRGSQNDIRWSREAASGATAYAAECALDEAFTSLLGSSGWIADTTYTFTGLADGRTYYYRVRCRDAAANLSPYSARTFSRQDATSPQSHLLALTGYKSSSAVNLEWAAVDSVSGVAGVQLYYSKDGGPYILYPGGPFTTSPIAFAAGSTGGDGQYAFYTLATDGVANAESAPETPDATTIIDTQPPSAPILAVLQSFTAGIERAVSWRSAKATGAVAYRAQASQSATFEAVAFESGWIADSTYTFTGLADGQRYYYRVQARDQAGNESNFADAASSTQDASAPETAVQALPAAMNTLALSIAWTGSDPTSGLASVQLYYSKDGAPFVAAPGGPFTASPIAFDAAAAGGDGVYGFYTRGTDAVGNAETAPAVADAGTRMDTHAPDQPTLATLSAYSPGTQLELHWTDVSASGATEYLAQAATDAAFTTLVAESGWIAANAHTFSGLADGQHYFYRVKARDAAGNETTFAASMQSTQDATAPSSQLAALPAWSTLAHLSLEWTASDATSGVAGVDLYYAKDGAPAALYAGSPFATSPIVFDAATTGGDGAYALTLRAHDAAGNIEAAPAQPDAEIRIDTQAPSAPVIAALPGFTPGTSRILSWTASGADEYLAQAATDAAFASIVAESGWITAISHTFEALADGQAYYYRVRARDAAHNESAASDVLHSTQDATPPATSIAALPALVGTSSLSIAWTGSDATSGLTGVDLYFSKDGGPALLYPGSPFASSPIGFESALVGGDGAYGFYTRGHDASGNAEAAPGSPDAATRIDTAPPGAPSIAGLQTFAPGGSLVLGWSDESASGAVEYLAEMGRDAGFSSLEATSGWTAERSHAFSGLTDGQRYFYRVKARDAVHNETGYSSLQSTTMDATAPQSAVSALPELSPTAALSLAWSGTDATSGVQNADLYYSKDGGPYSLYAGGPFASSPIAFDAATTGGDGHYRFYTRCRDAVGNLEPAPAAADAEITIDTAAPGVPALTALPVFSAGTSRLLTWSDQSASGATIYMAQAATDASFSSILASSGWITAITYTFGDLADAQTYYYRIKARDAAGNETAFSTTLQSKQDAAAPTSQIAALPAYMTHAALSLAWNGSDTSSGIAGVDLYYSKDGAPYELFTGSPFASSPIAFDTAPLGGDGEYRFYTRAHDAVNNIEAAPASEDTRTRIDTAAPEPPAIATLPGFLPGTSLDLQWNDASASGAVAYRAQVSAQASFAGLLQDSGWIAATQFHFAGLADGATFYYRVQARDAAGNETPFSAVASATQDATPPASQLAALPALSNGSALHLEWSATDMTSGVHGVDLYYSRDGGLFTLYPGSPLLANPIEFQSAAAGGDGQYAFFTRAHDGAGNVEAAPAAPDAQTRLDTTPPAMPTITSLPPFSAGATINLSWSNQSGSGATEYRAELSISPTFASQAAQSGWIAGTSYTFNGLDDGTTYYLRVKARDAAQNETAYAAAQSTTMDDTAPASQASPLPAVVTTATFVVAWTGSDATSGVAGVDLYYARESGPYTLYAGGPFASSPIAFNCTLTGGEGRYSFYTRARDLVGNREAAPAAPDAQTLVSTAAVPPPALASLPAFTPGASLILTWAASSSSVEYQVQAARDADFSAIQASSPWTNATSYTFSGLSDGQTYSYRLKGRNALGVESVWSAVRSSTQDATPPASQVSALPALSATARFDVACTASDATSGIAGVQLYVARNGGGFVLYPGGPFTSSPIAFDAAALGGDGSYAFYTRATDRAGNIEAAPAEADARTTVDTQAPSAPTMLNEPATTPGTTNTVAWSPAGGASEYFAQCAGDAMFQNVIAVSEWITQSSYTFTGLMPGSTYYYRVRARDAALNSSEYSGVVSSLQNPGYPLAVGWNLISFNLTPDDPRIDHVLTSIHGSYNIVRTYQGGSFYTYLPSLPLDMNDLTTMDPRQGYWIYMTRPDTLTVAGTLLAAATPIALSSGWGLVGYLPEGAMSPNAALASIQGSFSLARGYEPAQGYHTYYPSLPSLSDLGEMRAGRGYWLYMTAPDQLIYGAVGAPRAHAEPADGGRRVSNLKIKSGTGSVVPTVMDLWSTDVTIDGQPAPSGTVLEAYDPAGTLCGQYTLKQPGVLGLMHLNGDVSITDRDEGALPGDAITLKVRGADMTLVRPQSLAWEAEAARRVNLEFVNTESLLPKVFALAQNAPNPFNPSTAIAYGIPARVNGEPLASTHVQLRIYDIRGRAVRTLVNARQPAGAYVVQWDGRDENGQTVGAGVYFYRLVTEQFTKSRKMMLVK